MLQPDDIRELQNGIWELDCPKMFLRRMSEKDPDTYEGGGYIKRNQDGTLQFKLFDPEKVIDFKNFFRPRGVAGKFIESSEFYELTAIDHKGRTWKSDRIIPETKSSATAKGTVAYAEIGMLNCTIQKNDSRRHSHAMLELYFFDTFEIPGNTATEINTSVGGKPRRQKTIRNVAQFKSCGCDFEVRKEEMGAVLEITSDHSFPSNIEIRALEALQFVIGRPLECAIIQKIDDDLETISIRKVIPIMTLPKIGAPINPKDLQNISSVWNLYDKYLNFIISYEDKERYHSLSVFIIQVLKGSEASIDPMMLTLGIAVEGVLNEVFSHLKNLSGEELAELQKTKKIIAESKISGRNKDRIQGMLNSWNKHNAKAVLYLLKEKGIILEEEVKAWNDIRHPMAHAILPDTNDLQKLFDSCKVCTVLFYKLIFYAVGYRGIYTDYSSDNYPTKNFSF